MGNFLYRYRGWILGALGLALLLFRPSPWNEDMLPCGFFSALLLVVSAVLRVQARRSIGMHTRGKFHEAACLVTTGVYSRMRHPLYFSNTGVALAAIFWHFGVAPTSCYEQGMAFSYMAAAIFSLFVIIFEVTLSKMEDKFLEKRFGEEWRQWAVDVPAFLPKLKNRGEGPAQYERSFLGALKEDWSTWFWIFVAFAALTLRKIF